MSVRGEWTINGRTFAVAENVFAEEFSNSASVLRGLVSNDGQLVSMASSAQQLLIASAGLVYLFDLNLNTLSQIPAANFSGPVSMVGYSDGFFLALIANSGEFAVSGPLDATDWTTNGTAIVSVFPDNVVSMFVDHREVWFASATKTQGYYDSGNIFPFDVIEGAYIEQGIVAQWTFARLDNTIFWLGRDERGAGIVWRAEGYTPKRVSDHAIELAIQGYDRMDDAIAYSFQDQGHAFYHLYFPTAGKSWRYDTATGMWHQVGYWNEQKGDFEAHHSQVHTFNFGKHLVGDWSSDKIYEMHIPVEKNAVWTFADDAGNPIRRVRRAPHISDEQKRLFFGPLQIFIEAGLGPIPPLAAATAPTAFVMQDVTGGLWSVGVTDNGELTSQPAIAGTPVSDPVILTDDGPGTTSWQLGVDATGNITTTSVVLSANYPQSQAVITASGTFMAQLSVSLVGALEVSLAGLVSRGPEGMLRLSNDAGHTWGNETRRSAGKAGEYKKRMKWERLGAARDLIAEFAFSDPIGARIVDAYLGVMEGTG